MNTPAHEDTHGRAFVGVVGGCGAAVGGEAGSVMTLVVVCGSFSVNVNKLLL